MKCDLNVHTIHSGKCPVPGFSHFCLESYNEPRALCETLKQRGLDLVTVTLPSGTEMHAGVYGMEERDHIELQRCRAHTENLPAYARENRLFVTVNHAYSSLTGRRAEKDFAIFARYSHGGEVLNGHMLEYANQFATHFAARHRKPVKAGSDSLTLHGAGKTFTEIVHARNASEFVTALRRGHRVPRGESGNCIKLTEAISGIGGSPVRANPRAAVLAPLFALAPVFAVVNYCRERAFARYWGQKRRGGEAGLLAFQGAAS